MFQNAKALTGKVVQALTLALLVVFATATSAQAQVTLPDLGVDVAATATAIGTALGTVIAGLITIFGALYVVRLGMMWIKRVVK